MTSSDVLQEVLGQAGHVGHRVTEHVIHARVLLEDQVVLVDLRQQLGHVVRRRVVVRDVVAHGDVIGPTLLLRRPEYVTAAELLLRRRGADVRGNGGDAVAAVSAEGRGRLLLKDAGPQAARHVGQLLQESQGASASGPGPAPAPQAPVAVGRRRQMPRLGRRCFSHQVRAERERRRRGRREAAGATVEVEAVAVVARDRRHLHVRRLSEASPEEFGLVVVVVVAERDQPVVRVGVDRRSVVVVVVVVAPPRGPSAAGRGASGGCRKAAAGVGHCLIAPGLETAEAVLLLLLLLWLLLLHCRGVAVARHNALSAATVLTSGRTRG